MRERLVTPLHRAALTTFGRLPAPARWAVVRRTTPTFSVGALLVAVRGAEVLLLRQRHHAGWTLPGGLLSRGETPRGALRRELGEELGLHDLPLPEHPTVVAFHPAERHIDAIFVVDLAGAPELRLVPDLTEVLEAGWIRLDDPTLPSLTIDVLSRVPGLVAG